MNNKPVVYSGFFLGALVYVIASGGEISSDALYGSAGAGFIGAILMYLLSKLLSRSKGSE